MAGGRGGFVVRMGPSSLLTDGVLLLPEEEEPLLVLLLLLLFLPFLPSFLPTPSVDAALLGFVAFLEDASVCDVDDFPAASCELDFFPFSDSVDVSAALWLLL